MTEKLQVYKCEVCGNIVEMLHGGNGELVCCGKPMVLQVEGAVDAAVEKHVPVIEKTDNGIVVKIGSVPHPMAEEHYIEWAQLIVGDLSYRIFLNPGGVPEALFAAPPENVYAREYCNLHGLWKSS
jgi:superoxide reductase